MTVQIQHSAFIPRNYQIFAGLDVDKHSIAVTFCNHERLVQSLRLPYSAAQLLNYVRKQFPEQRLAFAYEAGPTGFGLYDDLVANNHTCLVVAPSMVPTAPGQRVKTNLSALTKKRRNMNSCRGGRQGRFTDGRCTGG